jgi:hypothetical protein
MSDMLSPLRRAERILGNRLIVLERQLPGNYDNSPLWAEYLQTLHELRELHKTLRPPPYPPDDIERRRRE